MGRGRGRGRVFNTRPCHWIVWLVIRTKCPSDLSPGQAIGRGTLQWSYQGSPGVEWNAGERIHQIRFGNDTLAIMCQNQCPFEFRVWIGTVQLLPSFHRRVVVAEHSFALNISKSCLLPYYRCISLHFAGMRKNVSSPSNEASDLLHADEDSSHLYRPIAIMEDI